MKYLLPIMLLVTVACSSHKQEKKEIEQEAASTEVKDSQSLGGTIHDLIANSKTLNETQKSKLTEILNANKMKAEELSAQSYKYRGVLIQELLTGKATESRIKILESDIQKIEKLRLKNTFDTVKKISAIVSRHPEHHEEFTRHMMGERGSIGR